MRSRIGCVVLCLLFTGCATSAPLGGQRMLEALRYQPCTPREAPDMRASRKQTQPVHPPRTGDGRLTGIVSRMVKGALVEMDAFERLLVYAGLDNYNELPARQAPLTPEEAAALYDVLLDKPVTLPGFGPRLAISRLLGEIMEGDEELARDALLQRLERFKGLVVLRPDGYLTAAMTGRTLQRVAPVQWKDGAFRARQFELGRFYSARNGMAIFPVDEQLREVLTGSPLAELYDDADVISRVLDGAEESFVELGLAIGQLVSHPIESVSGLRQLPEALAELIANSPAYLERFRLMTRGEQIKTLSKLTTLLITTYGAAGGTTRTVAATGRGWEAVSLPAVALTAEGALVLERVSVPVGRAVTALSGGPGAALILQRAHTAARGGQPTPAPGPGQWGPAREAMSRRAARYQEQVTGRPASEAYWVGGVGKQSGGLKFDGFRDGVLLEAKGPGYANKFNDDLTPKPWFAPSGAKQLVEQARRQVEAAHGAPIRWHVAEKKAAEAIRELLEGAGFGRIEVVHTPPLP